MTKTMNKPQTPTPDDSLVAAIEGDFKGMRHSDLVLTCEMLTRGREAWRKECEQAQRERDEARKELSSGRDGNWMDKWGACKVCDGEIPHGHTDSCDIYKMEQQLTQLKQDNAKLVEVCDEFRRIGWPKCTCHNMNIPISHDDNCEISQWNNNCLIYNNLPHKRKEVKYETQGC